MEAGGNLVEQNGNAVYGGESDDRELTLENLWTFEEDEIPEMCDAASDGGRTLKDNPEESATMAAINGCHDGTGGSDGGCQWKDNGGALEEHPQPPSRKEIEALIGCQNESGGCDDGVGGGGNDQKEAIMKKGPWTAAEDERLIKAVEEFGPSDWVTIEKYSGLGRTSKSCRLRWINHLRPNLKKGAFSFEEVKLVVKLHYKYGNKWSCIAKKLPGRTDNEIKNFWHSMIKKCKKQGLPLYPDWCREDDQTFTDDNGKNKNIDVNDPKNLISIPALENSTTTSFVLPPVASPAVENSTTASSFAPVSPPGVQLTSPPPPISQGHETLPCLRDQNVLSNSNLLPQNHSNFVHQYQSNSTFQSPQSQLWTPQEQDSSLPHYQPSSQEPSLVNQSFASVEPLSQNCLPSFQNFLSPRPKPTLNSSASTSISSSSPLLQIPQQNLCSSAQQPGSKFHPHPSSFKPRGPPPVLSCPTARFKRFQRVTRQLPQSALAASVSPFHSNTSSSSAPHSSSEFNPLTMEPPISPLGLKLSSPTLPDTSSFASKSEQPSIQSSRIDLKSIPEINQNLEREKSKICSEIFDTLLQETQVEEAGLSDLQLIKGFLLSKHLRTKHLYRNILRKKMLQNITSIKEVLLRESPYMESFSYGSSRNNEFIRTNPYSYAKSEKTINFPSGNSVSDCLSNFGSKNKDLVDGKMAISVLSNNLRRHNLLRETVMKEREVSETGILLVENTRKEVSVSKTNDSLNLSSTPEDIMLVERLDTEKLISESLSRESSKRKCPMSESLEKECSISTSFKKDQDSLEFSGVDLFDLMNESSKRICLRDDKNMIGDSVEHKRSQNGADQSAESGSGSSPRCSTGNTVKQDSEGDQQNTMPEELSSLLEFFPATACEFPGLQFLEQLDLCLELDMPLDSSPPMSSV